MKHGNKYYCKPTFSSDIGGNGYKGRAIIEPTISEGQLSSRVTTQKKHIKAFQEREIFLKIICATRTLLSISMQQKRIIFHVETHGRGITRGEQNYETKAFLSSNHIYRLIENTLHFFLF